MEENIEDPDLTVEELSKVMFVSVVHFIIVY
jgi:hypothetical protein